MWDAHSLAVCCPERSFEHSISALELPSLQPTPQHTFMSCMHDLAVNNKENHDATACMHDLAVNNKENHDATTCCGPAPKEPILSLGAD